MFSSSTLKIAIALENRNIAFRCSEVAIRCIELLVRHSAILRPISSTGRMRLRSDYHHLEHALKVLCPSLPDLGRPYRLFKSMATLVALTPEEIVRSQESGSVVPPSIILLLLFSFAGSQLASPHQNTGWSVQKLSSWLNEHVSETDRLDLIAGALQRYETLVRQKQSANYDPVYPIMCGFLEGVLKNK